MTKRLVPLAAAFLILAVSCTPEKEAAPKPTPKEKPAAARPAPAPKPKTEKPAAAKPAPPPKVKKPEAKKPDTRKPAPPPAKFDGTIGGWVFRSKNPMGSFSTEQKVTGKHSIKIVDPTDKDGSSTASARIKIDPKRCYKITWQTYPVIGSGLGIYIQFFDAKGEQIGHAHSGNPSVPIGKWVPGSARVEPPEDAGSLRIWLHSYQAAIVTAYVDDFKIEQLPPPPTKPPWEGTYKIKPNETQRLTEADVVGPDGIVYPDWTYAGVPGGIPTVPVKVNASDLGAKPDDEGDDSAALQRGVDALAKKGGGALLIGPGTFQLDRPILVESDGIVIRGSGIDKTRLIFRYKDGPTEAKRVCFFSPTPNSTLNGNSLIEIHCYQKDLMQMEIHVDDKRIRERTRSAHWGATFALNTSGWSVVKKVKDGKHTLRGVATYRNGSKHEAKIEVTVDTQSRDPRRKPDSSAVIAFRGKGYDGKKILLAEDGKRGSREVTLAADHDLKAGDPIFLRAPATERWKKLTQNDCRWGSYRDYYFVVEKVDGRKIRLNQPMRIDYPTIDGAYVRKWKPIRRCGAEDFYLEHKVPFWITGVGGRNAWECWARNLHVHKAGRHSIMFNSAKWCEVRDCFHDESWNNGGGGTAYVGWQHDCDCLMDNCKANRMRHGPCVQWAAAGNVIRNSTFTMSDGQWHAGWSTENLFENCVIDATKGTGSYGFGFWGSPPHDTAHGPEGPRNVIYNCDAKSPKGSLWMGGMNENWIIAYNRLAAETGPGVFARCASFDHIIRGNVFILKSPKAPAVELKHRDCIGVEIIDNRILGGSGKLCIGKAKPAVTKGNTFKPFGGAPRPKPAVPSIFEWQRKNKRGK